MKRREFIAATAALLVSPRHMQAQGKPRRIGFLGGFEYPSPLPSPNISILPNPGNPVDVLSLAREVPRSARTLGIAMPVVEGTTGEQLAVAFASAARQKADAIVVFGDTLFLRQTSRVVALAAE